MTESDSKSSPEPERERPHRRVDDDANVIRFPKGMNGDRFLAMAVATVLTTLLGVGGNNVTGKLDELAKKSDLVHDAVNKLEGKLGALEVKLGALEAEGLTTRMRDLERLEAERGASLKALEERMRRAEEKK